MTAAVGEATTVVGAPAVVVRRVSGATKEAEEATNTRLGRRPEGNLVPIHKYGACKWP
jgi:hypothetical protein